MLVRAHVAGNICSADVVFASCIPGTTTLLGRYNLSCVLDRLTVNHQNVCFDVESDVIGIVS